MGRYQSIISAIISAFCVFVVPWLNRKGIIIDETTATTIIAYIIGGIAFVWTAWKNHNITEAALQGQLVINELKVDEEMDEEPADDEVIED